MVKYIWIVLVLVCQVGLAQDTNGLEGGVNYSWYDHVRDDESQTADFGYFIGYKYEWHIWPRWQLSAGARLSLPNVSRKILHHDCSQSIVYGSIPLTVSYGMMKRWGPVVGYSFSYLLDKETSTVNHIDHSGLIGMYYDFNFFKASLCYQHSFNTERYDDVTSVWGSDGEVIQEYRYPHQRYKLRSIQFSLYIPLNKRVGDGR